ncbi:hypothetical protein COCNU_scaffold001677G000010 [Cocos nucifera]|nr:hypothetical protein [Cocos nucifera]
MAMRAPLMPAPDDGIDCAGGCMMPLALPPSPPSPTQDKKDDDDMIMMDEGVDVASPDKKDDDDMIMMDEGVDVASPGRKDNANRGEDNDHIWLDMN